MKPRLMKSLKKSAGVWFIIGVVIGLHCLANASGTPDFFSDNLYVRLGVSPESDKEGIRRAWAKLTKIYNTDDPDNQGSTRIMEKINEAKDVLVNARRRGAYDQLLKETPRVATAPASTTSFEQDAEKFREEMKHYLQLKKKYPRL